MSKDLLLGRHLAGRRKMKVQTPNFQRGVWRTKLFSPPRANRAKRLSRKRHAPFAILGLTKKFTRYFIHVWDGVKSV